LSLAWSPHAGRAGMAGPVPQDVSDESPPAGDVDGLDAIAAWCIHRRRDAWLILPPSQPGGVSLL